jgi:molybdopterin synthase catalytic subunit
MEEVTLTDSSFDLGALFARATSPHTGAIASFIGTTRDSFEGREVLRLEYEAYEPMAKKQIKHLIDQAKQQWTLASVVVVHRVGVVPVSEASIAIVCSSVHRVAALAAVSWLIDAIKAEVPIWKREVYADGSQWKANSEWRISSKRPL